MATRKIILVIVAFQYLMIISGDNTADLNCEKYDYFSSYTCVIKNKIIKNDSTLRITTSAGVHAKDINTIIFEFSKVATIPHLLFQHFKKLESLQLVNCGVTWLKENVLFHAHQLEILDLSLNKLKILTNVLINNTANILRCIDLEGNEIATIGNKVFSSLIKLETLYLSRNKLTELPVNVFKPLINLKWITLQFNRLIYLEDDLFRFNTKLSTIYLGNNKLKTVGRGLFRNVPQLQHIFLQHNDISDMEIQTPVDILNVDYNRLTRLHLSSSLTQLSANSNNISHLSCDDVELTNMRSLSVTQNSLRNLNCIDQMTNLKDLWLSDNNLSSLNASAFHKFPRLELLALSGTNINLQNGDFAMLQQLTMLDLSNNRFHEINNSIFKGLDELLWLFLDGNKLSELEVEKLVEMMPQIYHINFNDNDFACNDLLAITKKLGDKHIRYQSKKCEANQIN